MTSRYCAAHGCWSSAGTKGLCRKHRASATALEARQGRDGAAGSIGEADDIATAEGRDAKQEGE